ncbi:MAG: NADH-quinone oxidoreductase subunit N [Solirubrobacterales bacterium]
MSALTPILAAVKGPSVEFAPLLPFLILAGGALITLLISLFPGRAVQRVLTPLAAVATLVAAGTVFAIRFGDPDGSLLTGALALDDLALAFDMIFVSAAIVTAVLAWRSETLIEAGRGEFYSLLITTVLGMSVVASSTDLVTFFLGFELFSIPLYVLCAADLKRNRSLESGLKYLIIGSLGSATMLYGLAFIYGATGATNFSDIAEALAADAVAGDPILLVGVALTLAGLAFKASIAPFHQWTPDVYEGAPTPVTAFMAIATKAAVLAILLRLGAEAFDPVRDNWSIVLAVLAAVTIIVGNVGALAQESVKRMLAYSGVAQAGYLVAGVVVGTGLGAAAAVFYMFAYALMNIAPFAVIIARERAGAGDGLRGLRDLGRESPLLAWSMTLSMIALAGLPVTIGFMGKLLLIESAIFGDYAWLGVMIVIGSVISLGYYLKVVAAMWLGPPVGAPDAVSDDGLGGTQVVAAGGAPESDPGAHKELVAVAVLAALATVVFGVYPGPLLDIAQRAGEAFLMLRL